MGKIDDVLDHQLALLPREVEFCTNCVVSNQRPRIEFNEQGVCSACKFAEHKRNGIDWEARASQLKALCDKYRRTDGTYDVLVPCSGGKDASMVAHRLKHDYGMHPLTVTWAPNLYTDIGRKNMNSFINAGFTNIMATPNGRLNRKLARIGMEAVGDIFLPFIYGQMCWSFHLALQFNIKLVFYGENGEAEYGGTTKNNDRPFMPYKDWAEVYFKGVTVDDLIGWGLKKGLISPNDYDECDLNYYRPPDIQAMQDKNIQMHWFSYYHKWVPQENYYYAVENVGMEANKSRSEGTYSKYASLDDKLDGLHYYFACLKFGLGPTTSDAAHEVRDLHLTREEAVALVRRFDGEFPIKYQDEILEYLDMTAEEFHEVEDRFRNPNLWHKVNGRWQIKHRVYNLPVGSKPFTDDTDKVISGKSEQTTLSGTGLEV